tara:strand:- start:9287 stop:9457 length:171 start_codon:yes stop_codon:yes gene_type:complete
MKNSPPKFSKNISYNEPFKKIKIPKHKFEPNFGCFDYLISLALGIGLILLFVWLFK